MLQHYPPIYNPVCELGTGRQPCVLWLLLSLPVWKHYDVRESKTYLPHTHGSCVHLLLISQAPNRNRSLDEFSVTLQKSVAGHRVGHSVFRYVVASINDVWKHMYAQQGKYSFLLLIYIYFLSTFMLISLYIFVVFCSTINNSLRGSILINYFM
jgi:hypothetical protein